MCLFEKKKAIFKQQTEFEWKESSAFMKEVFLSVYSVIAAQNAHAIWKQWAEENLWTRNSGSGSRKGTSMRNIRHCKKGSIWRWWTLQFHLDSWQHIDQLLWILLSASSILWRLLFADCLQEFLYVGYPSHKTIDVCGCNGFMNIEIGVQIDNKRLFSWRIPL